MRRGGIELLMVLWLGACTEKSPPPPPPSPQAVKATPPEPQLPALGEVRFREWNEIEEESFLEIPSPEKGAELKWDFGPGRRLAYDFSESLTQRLVQEQGERRGESRLRERDRGVLELAAGRDRSAAAVVRVQTQEAFLNEQPLPRPPFEKNQTAVSECVVREDGTAELQGQPKGRADASFYLKSLLALPGDHPISTGTIRTKATTWVKVQRYECVRLESEFEVASESPAERHLMRGRVVSFFSPAERKFIRASAVVATSSRTNSLSKEGAWVTRSLDAVTTYRLKLLEGP